MVNCTKNSTSQAHSDQRLLIIIIRSDPSPSLGQIWPVSRRGRPGTWTSPLFEVNLFWKCAARLLDDLGGRPDAAFHALGQVLALHEGGEEPSDEGVAGAVGVHDLVLGDGHRGVLLGLAVPDDDDVARMCSMVEP